MSSDVGAIVTERPGSKLKIYEHAEMIARYNQLRKLNRNHKEALAELAEHFHRSPSGVEYIVRRYQPTTDLAQHILKAGAAKLAMRIVRKATVAEAVDVLSRKNMGVLAPKTEEGSGQQGFFLSVTSDSCGAVKVGVALASESPLGALESTQPEALECNGYTSEDAPLALPPAVKEPKDEETKRKFQGRIGKAASQPETEWSPNVKKAITAARNRIRKERVLRSRGQAKLRQREREQELRKLDGHFDVPE